MATLILDVAVNGDETFDQALVQLTDGLNLDASATGRNSGGGWPEAQFSGSRDALTALIERYQGPAIDGDPTSAAVRDEEILYHVGRIVD